MLTLHSLIYCLRNLRLRQNIVDPKMQNSLLIYLTDNLHKEETTCLKLTIETKLSGTLVKHSILPMSGDTVTRLN